MTLKRILARIESAATTTGREQKLKALNIPDPIIQSIEAAAVAGLASTEASARVYAGAIGLAASEYGIEGVKMQIAYLLLYLGRWQGEEARAHKKVLKKWTSSKASLETAGGAVPKLKAGDFYVVCKNGDVYGPYVGRGEAKEFVDHKGMVMDYMIDGADLCGPQYTSQWTSGKLTLQG